MLSLSKYLKTGKLLFVICLFLFKDGFSQNLIRNGSFENYHTPINWNWWGGDFIGYYSNPPDTVMIDWGQLNSPDFFMTACTHTYAGVPINRFGNSYSKVGNNYIGMGVYVSDSESKEYIYQKLSSPLQAGKIYCLSFYVSRADRTTYAIKNIGAYFSNNVQSIGTVGYVNIMPQITNQTGFISDTTQWTEIQGCFTANGGEQYITIGNFNPNANTDTMRINSTNQILNGTGTEFSYYYIDDITLIDQTTVGINELKISPKTNLSPNPNNGEMQLDYDLGNDNNATMNLYDVTGKLIQAYKLENNKGTLYINEQTLNNGIYFYHILVDKKSIKTDKIVIIK